MVLKLSYIIFPLHQFMKRVCCAYVLVNCYHCLEVAVLPYLTWFFLYILLGVIIFCYYFIEVVITWSLCLCAGSTALKVLMVHLCRQYSLCVYYVFVYNMGCSIFVLYLFCFYSSYCMWLVTIEFHQCKFLVNKLNIINIK